MKKILLVTVVFLTISSVNTFGQDEYSFDKGITVVNGGYGFPNLWKSIFKLTDAFSTGSKTTGWGPVTIGFEYGVNEKWGLGLQAGKSTVNSTFDDGSGYKSEKTLNNLSILARVNYHFANSAKFDPFLGGGIGYNNFKFTFKDNDSDPSNDGSVSLPIPIAITGAIGARYYFSSNVGLYGEVGYVAGAIFQAGVVLKFGGAAY